MENLKKRKRKNWWYSGSRGCRGWAGLHGPGCGVSDGCDISPPDSAALPSMRVCDSRTISRALLHAPVNPHSPHARTLALPPSLPAHTYVIPLPSPPVPAALLQQQAHPDSQRRLSIHRLQTDVDAQADQADCLFPVRRSRLPHVPSQRGAPGVD